MPSKRRQTNTTPSAKKAKTSRTVSSSSVVDIDTNTTPAAKKAKTSRTVSSSSVGDIDYDKLAAAIIKQQNPDDINPVVPGPSSTCTPIVNVDEIQDSNTDQFGSFLQNIFSGESVGCHNGNTFQSPPISVSEGIPLGTNISVRIKQKIWNNSVISMKCLLPNFKEDNVSINIDSNSIQFNKKAANQDKLTLNQWTTAFLIFICIYIEKYPSEASNLLKYCSTVREIGASHGDVAWHYYDENFRQLRQSNAIPWQVPITEFMVKACTIHKPFRAPPQSSQARLCFNFNNGTKCRATPCQYRHSCQICKESHPKISCPRKDKSKSNKKSSNYKTPNTNQK